MEIFFVIKYNLGINTLQGNEKKIYGLKCRNVFAIHADVSYL